jgi:hypothetical protein
VQPEAIRQRAMEAARQQRSDCTDRASRTDRPHQHEREMVPMPADPIHPDQLAGHQRFRADLAAYLDSLPVGELAEPLILSNDARFGVIGCRPRHGRAAQGRAWYGMAGCGVAADTPAAPEGFPAGAAGASGYG